MLGSIFFFYTALFVEMIDSCLGTLSSFLHLLSAEILNTPVIQCITTPGFPFLISTLEFKAILNRVWIRRPDSRLPNECAIALNSYGMPLEMRDV